MQNQANVYIFNPLIAFEMAQSASSEEQIFFYDGQKLEHEPTNCINVPIDDFVTYFLGSPYPYPQEINFDTMNFSSDIQNAIIQNLTMALESVKLEKLEQLNNILDAKISTNTVQQSLYFLLEYISINNFVSTELPFDIIQKLLTIVKFISTQNILVEPKTLFLVKKLFSFVEQDQETSKNFYLLHLRYALSLLQKNEADFQQEMQIYFDSLAAFNNIPQLIQEFQLIKMLFQEEDLQEYLENLSNSLFRSDFLTQDILVQKYAVFKFYYLTSIHYDRGKLFTTIFYTLKKIFELAIANELDELLFYLYTPLLMSWTSVSQTQEEFKYFNDTIEKPLEKFIMEVMTPKYNIKKTTRLINKNKKIKVGFVQERMMSYSVYEVLYLLIKSLKEYDHKQYEFIVYDLNFQELGGSNIQSVEKLKALGITYVNLHKECVGDINAFYSITNKSLQIRKKIIKDKIDILIGMNTRAEYNFLYTTRTAPLQIYWSHINHEYNLKEIDQYTSHFQVGPNYSNYKIFHLPIDLDAYNPQIDPETIQTTRALYPNGSFILGSIGRLIKIDNEEYLETVASIMKQNPDTIYLACGEGDKRHIKAMVKKYGIEDRFYFTGRVDANLYGHIIDLMLSPFPYSGGRALQEYMYKGKPFVIKSGIIEDLVKQHQQKDKNIVTLLQENSPLYLREIYTQENLESLEKNGYLYDCNKHFATYLGLTTVETTQEYIDVANFLISNPIICQKIAKEAIFDAHIKNQDSIKSFFHILDALVNPNRG